MRYAPTPDVKPLHPRFTPFTTAFLVRSARLLLLITHLSKVSDWGAQISWLVRSKTRLADEKCILFCANQTFPCTALGRPAQTTWSSKCPISFSSVQRNRIRLQLVLQFVPARRVAHNTVALIPVIAFRRVRICYRELNIPGWRKSFCVGRKFCIKSLCCVRGLVRKGFGDAYMLIFATTDFFSFDFLICYLMSFDYGPLFVRDVFLKVFWPQI